MWCTEQSYLPTLMKKEITAGWLYSGGGRGGGRGRGEGEVLKITDDSYIS